MSKFKPQISYRDDEGKYISKGFSTYALLKKHLIKIFNESNVKDAFVSRSRRGEWGEWFECWDLSGSKPIITKDGWQ